MKKIYILSLFLLCVITNMVAQDYAELYIYRNAKNGAFGMGDMMTYDILVNNIRMVELTTKGYVYVKIPVNQVVNVKVTDVGCTEAIASTGLKAKAGEVYAVRLSLNALYVPQIDLLQGSKALSQAEKMRKYDILGEFDVRDLPNTQLDNLAVNTTNVQTQEKQDKSVEKVEKIISDVDQNIPQGNNTLEDTYVLIIANEDYQFVDDVNYAAHDGEVFKEYCIKTLGVPERQIRHYVNASYGIISGGIDWLKYALSNFEGSKAIVYYCGHGIPDEKTGDAYIIPVDGKGTNTTTCYSLNKLYTTLASTNASNVTYFMDACFTGANKEGSMLVAARGVAREAKKETLQGNAVVFSASSGDETAMTHPEKGHGLFTYFLLKKLQSTRGQVSYAELADYIKTNVRKEAFLINEKPQTPVVATSIEALSSWETMTFK